MIAKSYILKNLKALDKHFINTNSSKDSLFYSKLALLELCGWIEESIGYIVLRCADRKLNDNKNKK